MERRKGRREEKLLRKERNERKRGLGVKDVEDVNCEADPFHLDTVGLTNIYPRSDRTRVTNGGLVREGQGNMSPTRDS